MKFKTVFLGTPDFVLPTIEYLHKETELVGIVTGPDRHGGRGNKVIIPEPKKFAIENKIPFYQPDTLKEGDVVEQLLKIDCDIFIVYAFGFILPKKVLDIPKLAPINLHGSLLPKYRGASPIHAALLNGDTESGITAQIMVEKLDAGDIVYQIKTPINDDDDYESLNHRLSLLAVDCLKDVFSQCSADNMNRTAQNKDEVSICRKIKKEAGIINWENSYESIYRQIRAYSHWPHSYTYHGTMQVTIHEIEKGDDTTDHHPGEIIKADKSGLFVQCGTGVVQIINLQPQGKKAMDYKSFLNGHKWKTGDQFQLKPKK